MKLIIPAVIFLIAASLAGFTEIAAAPEVITKRGAKLYYDRIELETVAFQQAAIPTPQAAVLAHILAGKPCSMPGRVKWQGECWLPERIPREVER